MKTRWAVLSVLALGQALAESPAAPPEQAWEQAYRLIRANDLPGLRALLKHGFNANLSDRHQITLLMSAAETGSVDAMKILLAGGADVNTANAYGSTALMWSAADAGKVALLLQHGADVNRVSQSGRTALIIAAMSNPSAAIVRMMLASGANARAVDKGGLTVLNAAAMGNDTATVRILADAGGDVNTGATDGAIYSGATPLMNAAANRNVGMVQLLLARGANVNAVSSRDRLVQVRNGSIALGGFTPLLLAAPYGPPDLVKTLLEAGAGVNATDIRGMTPLMLAIATDRQNPAIVNMLLAHGAETGRTSAAGETALDWARKFGRPSTMAALGGGKSPAPEIAPATTTPDLPVALDRSVALLEKSSTVFFKNSGCFGCHAQVVTEFADSARARTIHLDADAAQDRRRQITNPLEGSGPQSMERLDPPGAPDFVLFALEALIRTGYAPDRLTDFMTADVAAMQGRDGSWHLPGVARAPMEDSDFTRTALAIRALKTYGTPGRQIETKARIEKARQWLLHNEPVTTEDFDMRLVGAASAGGSTLKTLARPILERQRADGGWAQCEDLASDAYATGMTLWALAESGILRPGDAAYQRGVQFLLATQHEDGSWFVASRAVRLQPYFDGGFPYGHDQWISSTATGWAANALALALDVHSDSVASAAKDSRPGR